MCVLLVEDELLIADLMSEILREAGYDVLVASSGDEALKILAQPPTQFTVLVSDFHMPGRANGLDVAACIRDQHPALPVIIMSGRSDVLAGAEMRSRDYHVLAKPFLPSTLVELVSHLTARSPPPE